MHTAIKVVLIVAGVFALFVVLFLVVAGVQVRKFNALLESDEIATVSGGSVGSSNERADFTVTVGDLIDNLFDSQDDERQDLHIRILISSLRPSAVSTSIFHSGDTDVCDEVLRDSPYYNTPEGREDIDTQGWQWQVGVQCDRGTLTTSKGRVPNTAGQACCMANGRDWVLWSSVSSADGWGSNADGRTPDTDSNQGADIYCADSGGFLGERDLSGVNDALLPSKPSCGSSTNTPSGDITFPHSKVLRLE